MPWVVVDWGIWRSLPTRSTLPGTFTAILADRTSLEAFEANNAESLIAKLNAILVHPSAIDRVLIGLPPGEVICDEPEPNHASLDTTVIIDVESSSTLREAQRRRESFLRPFRGVNLAGFPPDWKDGFKQLVREFETWLREKRPEEHRLLRSESSALSIKYPGDDIAGFVCAINSRYGDGRWQKMLRSTPDRCAIGRWANLIMWYGRKYVRALQNDHNLGNDFDDAHYAFLSLYTGHLWTRDRGLKLAARNVSDDKVLVCEEWRGFTRTRRAP